MVLCGRASIPSQKAISQEEKDKETPLLEEKLTINDQDCYV